VLATVSRNIGPESLVGYATAILENARAAAIEREHLPEVTAEGIHTGAVNTGPVSAVRSPPLTPAGARLPELDKEARQMWETALSQLELQMTRPTFNTWLRPTVLLSWTSETDGRDGQRAHIVLGASNGYVKDWLENRLITPIQRTLSGIIGGPVELQIEVSDDPKVQRLFLQGD